MPKNKMRDKDDILHTVHNLWGKKESLNVKILTLEALLDIRDILVRIAPSDYEFSKKEELEEHVKMNDETLEAAANTKSKEHINHCRNIEKKDKI